MKILLTILILTASIAQGQSLLRWNASNINSDGSPLTDLSHYAVYTIDGATSTVISIKETEIPISKTCGVEYWVIAVDTSGNESAPLKLKTWSCEASKADLDRNGKIEANDWTLVGEIERLIKTHWFEEIQ